MPESLGSGGGMGERDPPCTTGHACCNQVLDELTETGETDSGARETFQKDPCWDTGNIPEGSTLERESLPEGIELGWGRTYQKGLH